ncbi:MAG TPA: hypothetical protein PLR41_05210 [Alphaproteobacteria bacterium]|nr:hypothetical protein [Alphaproteobacteria bacterium]
MPDISNNRQSSAFFQEFPTMPSCQFRAAVTAVIALLLLSACAGARPPVFQECGGNNCHSETRFERDAARR